MRVKTFLLLTFCLIVIQTAFGQQPAVMPGPSVQAEAKAADSVMVTVMLKHQQDKNLPEIRRVLEAQGFWEMFPPQDCRVVSWTMALNLGHIITMQVPAGAVRRLNLAIENGAWGAYSSEIFLSYDYKPIWEDYIEKREEAKEERN
jgi:hypothetical protein